MTDIVARLRALSPYGGTIGAEAADEIERLTRQVDLFKNTLEATEQTVKMQAEEIERLRAEAAKLVDENTRLQEWKDVAMAAAEDRHEYVLAQINAGLKEEITRLKAETGHQHDEISRLDKEIDRLRRDAQPGDGAWSEIERLRAENEVLRELSEVHSYD